MSVLVIDWTVMGAPPPILTFPKKSSRERFFFIAFSLRYFKVPTISVIAEREWSSRYFSRPVTTSLVTDGLTNWAVPIWTAEAPAMKNSRASSAVQIPPIPTTGMFTVLHTSHTMRRAMGLIAGPESPPVMFPNRGVLVSMLTAIPISVLMRESESAPASSALRAMMVTSVTLGESLTMMGRDDDFLTVLTTLKTSRGSVPKEIPPSGCWDRKCLPPGLQYHSPRPGVLLPLHSLSGYCRRC